MCHFLFVEDALKLVDRSYLFWKNLFFTAISNDENSRKMNVAGNCFCFFWMSVQYVWVSCSLYCQVRLRQCQFPWSFVVKVPAWYRCCCLHVFRYMSSPSEVCWKNLNSTVVSSKTHTPPGEAKLITFFSGTVLQKGKEIVLGLYVFPVNWG